jgi:hypothetical protein
VNTWTPIIDADNKIVGHLVRTKDGTVATQRKRVLPGAAPVSKFGINILHLMRMQ